MIFSLILPVYKVEKYISACVESCCRQRGVTRDEFEIILVDDGSPDGSIERAISVLQRYPEIIYRVVHRVNGGLSAARNTGLDNARGDYIWFIDSDDYIAEDALSVLKQAILRYSGVEIISFGYNTVYADKEVSQPLPEAIVFDNIATGMDFLREMTFLSAWARIYSRQFLVSSGLKFTEGILWEDGELNLKLLSVSNRHVCLKKCLYYYLRRPGSISTGKNVEKTLRSDLIIFDNHYHWLMSHDFPEEDRKMLASKIIRSLFFVLAGIPELKDKKIRREMYREVAMRHNQLQELAVINGTAKTKGLVKIIKAIPHVFAFFLYKRMQRILAKDAAQLISRP